MPRKRIPEEVIKVHLPNIQQVKLFSCGAAALQSIMTFFGAGPIDQEEYITALKTDSKNGTRPNKIVKFARNHGLRVRIETNMELAVLEKQLDKKRPVICAIQAWCGDRIYDGSSGHYVTAVGYDDKFYYFQDSLIQGYWGYLPKAEMIERWHDWSGSKKFNRLGITIWKSGHSHYLQRAVKIE